jgi:hypothetical protein
MELLDLDLPKRQLLMTGQSPERVKAFGCWLWNAIDPPPHFGLLFPLFCIWSSLGGTRERILKNKPYLVQMRVQERSLKK